MDNIVIIGLAMIGAIWVAQYLVKATFNEYKEERKMSSDIWGKLRTIGLLTMIICACIADAILYWQGQIIWAIFWSCIIGLVAGFEIFAYMTQKKTISTMWKDWAQKSPFWAYTTLIVLATALNGLWLHLAVWGCMFGCK